jgi:hypothetical protein
MKTTKSIQYKGFIIETVFDSEDGKTWYQVKENGKILEEGTPCIQDHSEALTDGKEMVNNIIVERYPGSFEDEEHDDTPSLGDTFDHAKNP